MTMMTTTGPPSINRGKRRQVPLIACTTCFLTSIRLTWSFSALPILVPPHHTRHLATSQKWLDDDETTRAGADGYSVLRQPASRTSWDPDTDPGFDVPTNLNRDSSSSSSLDDYTWWTSRRRPNEEKNHHGEATKLEEPSIPRRYSSKQEDKEDVIITQPDDLDLFQRSWDTLDYPRVLIALEKECTTSPGRNLVKRASVLDTSLSPSKKKIPARFLSAYQPLAADTVQGCQERYAAVQEMEWILGTRNMPLLEEYSYRNRQGYKESLAGRPPPLGGNAFNLESLLDHAATRGRVLEGPDILEVSSMLDALENIQCWSDGLQKVPADILPFVELPKLASGITVNTTLQDLLRDAFDDDGRLSGTTFPTVGRLRARVRALKANVLATLDSLLATPSMKSKLTLESGGPLYSEVSGGRLVVPLDSKHASTVGIVHDTSRSGKTVYVEPTEIVAPTNELRQTESELRTEEAGVWRSLTAELLHNRVTLEAAVAAAGQLDVVLARVLLGRQLSGVVPVVRDEGVISVRDGKHPVLLLRHVENVVGSDVELGANGNQGLVLTGPNSGGKTVILKMLGLYALMSRAGIPIPAAPPKKDHDENVVDYHPRVDFFNPVLADIGDIQSVGGDLSTFSGHMLVCREVLANAGRNALVLMDEVGSGTDPAQGVAIAQALLEALMETGARVAITTHYMQLKQLAASDNRFAVAGMQFVNGRPTYRLLPGTVGESFALAVAERLELPKKVIERANELLDSETRQMGDLIRELEDQKAIMDQKAIDLEEKRKEMASMKFKVKEETLRLEKKQLSARREEAKRFAQKLEAKERVLEDILEKLKSDPTRRIVAKSWDDIKFVKRDALNEAENVPSVVARKKKAAAAMEEASAELVPLAELRDKPDLKEGDSLIVCTKGPLFGREATIIKSLGARVEVRVNGMNVGLKLTEVALPTTGQTGVTQMRVTKKSKVKSISRAAEKAIAAEMNNSRGASQATAGPNGSSASSTGVVMRTQSNTVDVRGCNLEEAKEKATAKFSSSLMAGRPVVFILHGHGTGGVLKSKIRNWLKSERQTVKRWQGADVSDGGDAFTRVELR